MPSKAVQNTQSKIFGQVEKYGCQPLCLFDCNTLSSRWITIGIVEGSCD